ncbi:hypothetical protein LTR65_008368 [Meristemomyces frigidus]
MGTLSSIADGLLIYCVLGKATADLKHAGLSPYLVMVFAVIIYWIASGASKGTEIWNLMVEILGSGKGSSDKRDISDHLSISKSLFISQCLESTASGMLLLFAIGFALFCASLIRRLSTTHTFHKRLCLAVGVLSVAFLIRNTVMFVFFLIYSQYHHVAPFGVQLVYMSFHGLLSVVVYVCILAIATVQEGEEPLIDETEHGQVQKTAVTEGDRLQQDKAQVNLSTGPLDKLI